MKAHETRAGGRHLMRERLPAAKPEPEPAPAERPPHTNGGPVIDRLSDESLRELFVILSWFR